MPAITLSPSFFKNELRAYTNWRSAFWRELFQNSVDAKASTIWIDFRESPTVDTDASNSGQIPDNTTSHGNPNNQTSIAKGYNITFEDDGPGMDRATLEETYFVVGETTKSANGDHTIGGFGRARIITCFAHRNFKIHTQNWLCHGSGTHYTIEQAQETYEGCQITVTIDPQLASMEAMEQALRAYLATCQLDTTVYIRGGRFKDWTYKNRLVGELPFGKIYLNKSKCSNGVLVRVNGVQMFTRYTASTWQIVLEITPNQSRETLTSNRDGLTADAANELDKFVGKIWVDPVSAIRHQYPKTVKTFGNTVYRVHHTPNPPRTPNPHHTPKDQAQPITDHNRDNSSESRSSPERPSTPDTQFYERNLTPGPSNGHTPTDNRSALNNTSPHTPCYVHVVDCATPELARAAKSFLPEHITGIRAKLLEKWTQKCARAASQLAKLEGKTFAFRTGFLFNEEDLARCTQEGSIYTLLLTPVDRQGLLRYKLTSKTDSGALQANAAHEVVHMVLDYHDERFAAKLTELVGHLM